jgi:hypothetical protein
MRVIIKSIIFVLLNIVIVTPVLAGSFSDGFKSWVLDEGVSVSVAKAEPVRLDAISAECMQCHSGRNSGHIVVKSADSAMQFTASGRQSNHPINMKYDDYATNDPNSYRPRSLLDPNISLVNGKVMCISCHQQKNNKASTQYGFGFNKELSSGSFIPVSTKAACTSKKTLTVGPRMTDLCLACHTI